MRSTVCDDHVVVAATGVEDLRPDAIDAVVLCQEGDEACRLSATRAAREMLGDLPLIAIWSDDGVADARRALRAGLDGILTEADVATRFACTLEAVLAGLSCLPGTMRASLQTDSLSTREKQVLGLVVGGATNAQIAERLYLAESTVKSHLSSAYTKLGVRSRRDATTLILSPEEGLGPGILAIVAA